MVDVSTADPLLGQVLDRRYRIVSRVARGGMATVYTAVDERLDRTVAVKVMHPSYAEDDEFVERFRREAKAAAKLSHPNVVAVFDQGEDASRVYLVMEHVPGRTLREVLRDHGRLEPAAALHVLDGLLEALAAAHDAGLVHRDVKPENVLIAPDERVKVADFGLARAIEATHHTIADGTLIGTVAYLAPEQVVTGAADQRTDIYAAGVVLFEMLAGGPPYSGDTPLAVAYRHVNEDVPPPSTLVSGVPRALDQIVAGATRRDADARYPDARTMLSAVRRARAALGTTATSVIPLADAPTVVTTLPRAADAGAARTGARAGGAQPTTTLPAAPPAKPVPPLPAEAAARRPRRKRMVLALICVLVLAAAAVTGWYLGSGRYVDTPPLTGMTLAAARTTAAGSDVTVREGEQVFSEQVAPGEIVDQDPDPGDRIRRGGTVTVRVSKGPERVAMPTVEGKSEREARDLLARERLETGRVTREYHDSVAEGRVIRASQRAGAQLKPGTAVDLVVSRGRPPVEVPNVVGQQLGRAGELLAQRGLKYHRTLEYSERPAGEVLRQDPGEGATLYKGDRVNLVVSNGPPPVTVPRVIGMSRDRAREVLEQAGLRANFLDFPGRRGNRVVDQDPDPGRQVPRGSTVDLYMF